MTKTLRSNTKFEIGLSFANLDPASKSGNMRILKLLSFAFLILYSCNEKKEETVSDIILPDTDSLEYVGEIESEPSALADLESNSTFQNWLKFYKSADSGISVSNFNLTEVQKLDTMRGNVTGNFDPAFDKTYEPFLIYNPSKTMYLDIDSYNWSIDNEGVVQFEADQEVNLVSLTDKTVSRVAFFGPSHWVDDAFWVSDSIFVLLENGNDNQPGIMTYNLKDNSIYLFSSDEISPSNKKYIQSRLEKNGVKFTP